MGTYRWNSYFKACPFTCLQSKTSDKVLLFRNSRANCFSFRLYGIIVFRDIRHLPCALNIPLNPPSKGDLVFTSRSSSTLPLSQTLPVSPRVIRQETEVPQTLKRGHSSLQRFVRNQEGPFPIER